MITLLENFSIFKMEETSRRRPIEIDMDMDGINFNNIIFFFIR